MKRGEIWWADLDNPVGSAPGYRRPVLIVQADWLLATKFGTVMVLPLTSNLRTAAGPGNVLVQPIDSGLSKPSVICVSQVFTTDRSMLHSCCSRLSASLLRAVEDGMRLTLNL